LFVECIKSLTHYTPVTGLQNHLIAALTEPWARPRDLAGFAGATMRTAGAVAAIHTRAAAAGDNFKPAQTDLETLAADRLHGARPIVQGFVVAGAALTWTSGQALAAKRGARLLPRTGAAIGFALLLTAVGAVAPVLMSSWPLLATFFAWSIGGLGMGILFNPTTVGAMTYATDGREGEISSQIHLADSLGFGVMSVVGGATVAFADHTGFSLRGAIGINFSLAATCAFIGLVASRAVRSNTAAAITASPAAA